MAGLRFVTGLDVAAAPQARYGTSPQPMTATEAAFGPANEPAGAASALNPGGPGGLALWAGIGGVVFLYLVYRSLPG